MWQTFLSGIFQKWQRNEKKSSHVERYIHLKFKKKWRKICTKHIFLIIFENYKFCHTQNGCNCSYCIEIHFFRGQCVHLFECVYCMHEQSLVFFHRAGTIFSILCAYLYFEVSFEGKPSMNIRKLERICVCVCMWLRCKMVWFRLCYVLCICAWVTKQCR